MDLGLGAKMAKLKKMSKSHEKMAGKRLPNDPHAKKMSPSEIAGENDSLCPHCGGKL